MNFIVLDGKCLRNCHHLHATKVPPLHCMVISHTVSKIPTCAGHDVSTELDKEQQGNAQIDRDCSAVQIKILTRDEVTLTLATPHPTETLSHARLLPVLHETIQANVTRSRRPPPPQPQCFCLKAHSSGSIRKIGTR